MEQGKAGGEGAVDTAGTAPRPGRPRGPEIAGRIIEAAIDLYAEVGKAGFNFEAVARRAGVGKPAIYLRWSSPADLLMAAMDSIGSVRPRDCGSLRADLRDYALRLLEFYLTSGGAAYLRWQLEQLYDESLKAAYDVIIRDVARAARQVVHRAAERGELPSTGYSDLLLEAVHGIVFTRVTSLRVDQRPQIRERAEEFVEAMLDLLLDGATHSVPSTAAGRLPHTHPRRGR